MTSPRIILVAAMSVSSLLLAGCSPGQGPQSTQPSTTVAPTATAAQTQAVTASPPAGTATPAVTSATQSSSPSASAPAAAAPPAAHLGGGSADVEGELRTYCWLGTCADAFELPPMSELPPLAVGGTASELTLRLADDAPFINWQASYGDGAIADLIPLERGGEEYDPDTTSSLPPMLREATFAAPPPGEWIVYVVVRGVEGDAHYAWQVSVP